MIPEFKGRQIGVRLSKEDANAIDRLLKSSSYKSMSEIARTALTQFLKKEA